MKVKILLSFLIFLSFFSYTSAKIIYIPSPSLATIQGGVNFASNGDTVLVNVGTYYENVDFKGKNIVVASRYLLEGDSSLIDSTIIDATIKSSIPVVTFKSGEDYLTILNGFTICNSINSMGIVCDSGSSPKITYNRIKNNHGGLTCSNFSHPLIKDNILKDNADKGIQCETGSSPLIENNFISGALPLGNKSLGGWYRRRYARQPMHTAAPRPEQPDDTRQTHRDYSRG